MGFSLKSLLKPALGIAGAAVGGPLGGIAGSAIGGLLGGKKKQAAPAAAAGPTIGNRLGTALDQTQAQSFGNAGYSGLQSWDPSKAFEKYSAGAEEGIGRAFSKGIDSLAGSAVGRNRLNTGFFDEDVGQFGRDLAADYREKNASMALQTAGMEGDKFRTLAGIDETRTDRGLDFLSGAADREQGAANAAAERKANRKNSIIGGIASIGGAALGGWLGRR